MVSDSVESPPGSAKTTAATSAPTNSRRPMTSLIVIVRLSGASMPSSDEQSPPARGGPRRPAQSVDGESPDVNTWTLHTWTLHVRWVLTNLSPRTVAPSPPAGGPVRGSRPAAPSWIFRAVSRRSENSTKRAIQVICSSPHGGRFSRLLHGRMHKSRRRPEGRTGPPRGGLCATVGGKSSNTPNLESPYITLALY